MSEARAGAAMSDGDGNSDGDAAAVAPTLDLDILNRWRGRRRERDDTIGAQPVEFLRATLDQPWFDDLRIGAPLPCAWHWIFFLEAAPGRALGRDGHPLRGDFLPPVALPRRMWAGGRLEFAAPICIGEELRRVSTVADIARKTGRSGELCFVTVRHQFFSGSRLKMTEQHDIVYREDPAPGAPGGEDSPPVAPASPSPTVDTTTGIIDSADTVARITPTPVMLFRYSALTFNSHRIHYDADYCRQVEGFPGPVVHGALTATFLAGLAAQHSGALPRRFAYRALRPLYAGAPVTLSARQQGGGLQLQAADARGRLAMTAEMELA
ncbi:MAG: MaoC family dehydratase N-terminal domain-containing protein [Gammaproteobacteria bacterium]|nr:MaoC family dehydratase N-terminal domain-containing protein [Gammaproteobacteria bacterium]